MVQRSGIDTISSTTPDPGYQWESDKTECFVSSTGIIVYVAAPAQVLADGHTPYTSLHPQILVPGYA